MNLKEKITSSTSFVVQFKSGRFMRVHKYSNAKFARRYFYDAQGNLLQSGIMRADDGVLENYCSGKSVEYVDFGDSIYC